MSFNQSAADVLFIKGEHERAAKMYYEGARAGEAKAAFDYAHCLRFGYGVAKDLALAKSFYTYARDLEGGVSLYNLAIMYLNGEGVEQDLKKALRYMQDAASESCVEAMLYLGMAYTTGYMLYPEIIGINMIPFHKPILRDTNEFLLMGDVAEAEADEERRFSVLSADARRAFEYFRAAAYHDPTYVEDLVAKGQYLYAKCYLDGMGTDFDRSKALTLMLVAGKSGSSDAVEYLESNGITHQMLLDAANDLKNRK